MSTEEKGKPERFRQGDERQGSEEASPLDDVSADPPSVVSEDWFRGVRFDAGRPETDSSDEDNDVLEDGGVSPQPSTVLDDLVFGESTYTEEMLDAVGNDGLDTDMVRNSAQAASSLVIERTARPAHSQLASTIDNADSVDVQSHMQRGRHCLSASDWQGAVRAFQAALRVDLEIAQAHLGLGLAYWQQGRLEEAMVEYRTALRFDRDSAEAHFSLGLANKRLGHLEEAIQEYRSALRRRPDFTEARHNLAVVYWHQDRLSDAVEGFGAVLTHDAQDVDGLFGLGACYQREGDLERAYTAYQKVLAIAPNHARAHYNIGVIDLRRGNVERAQAELRRAQDLGYTPAHELTERAGLGPTPEGEAPQDILASHKEQHLEQRPMAEADEGISSSSSPRDEPSAHTKQAETAAPIQSKEAERQRDGNRPEPRASGDLTESPVSRELPRQLSTVDERPPARPKEAQRHFERGQAYAQRGEWASAINEYQEALQCDPTLLGAQLELGKAYAHRRRWEDALAELEAVLEQSPRIVDARVEMGKIYARQQRWDEAIDAFQTVLEAHPNDASAHFYLGLSHTELGHWSEAVQYAERADELGYPRARNLLSKLDQLPQANHSPWQKAPDDKADGVRSEEPAAEPATHQARQHLKRGVAHAEQGRWDEAIGELGAALEIEPDFVTAQIELGKAYARKKEWDAAKQAFERAIELQPENANTHFYIGLVYAEQGEWNKATKEFQAALQINPEHVEAKLGMGVAYSQQIMLRD